jgi:hypothetical protein
VRTVKSTTSWTSDPGHPARRFLRLAAVLAAALASMATSQAPPPQVPRPVAVAADACASLALQVCETSPGRTFVVVEATGVGVGSCTVAVVQAEASSAHGGSLGDADRLPAPVTVRQGETGTFSLAFPGSVEEAGRAAVRLEVRSGLEGYAQAPSAPVLTRACTAR